MTGHRCAEPSRRAVLAACGTGLAAFAGCSTVDLGSGDEDDREFDVARLSAVARAGVPTPPDAFPVEVTAGMVDRHLDRARALLSAVPERPDLPNEVVVQRLADDREAVAEALEAGAREGVTGLDRLANARHVRADAAEVEGAYRAATRAIDGATVEERRATLRSDSLAFEADWAYRGDDPAAALAVHAELEDRHRAARRNAQAWPPFPEDPGDDVFRVGEILRAVEAGRASLGDAQRLREQYLEGVADPTTHLATFTVAAHELEDLGRHRFRRLDEYVEAGFGPESIPVDRSLEDTPALELYRAAVVHAERGGGREGERLRRAGEYASAILSGVNWLASLRALEAAVDAIEAGEYGRPETAGPLATERDAAVDALEAAWTAPPTPISTAVAWPAEEAIDKGIYRLERTPDPHDVDRALGRFAYARLYAEAVPGVVEHLDASLERDS